MKFFSILFQTIIIFFQSLYYVYAQSNINILQGLHALPNILGDNLPRIENSRSGSSFSNKGLAQNSLYLSFSLSQPINNIFRILFKFDDAIEIPMEKNFMVCFYSYSLSVNNAPKVIPCEILNKNTLALYMDYILKLEITFYFPNLKLVAG